MKEMEKEYRRTHGVVPQLDFVNYENPFELIEAPQVQYSALTNQLNALKHVSAKKVLGGFGNLMEGVVSLGTGNFSYGLGKILEGTAKGTVGAVDRTGIEIDKIAKEKMTEAEEEAWQRYYFLKNFVPAEGRLGDIYFQDGSCDDFHCGNGYRIFENGDYFEGYFEDGEIRRGIYIFADGERYLGEFYNDRKSGKGLTLYKNGTRYDGMYREGKRHGFGSMWYSDGFYWGEFVNDIREGYGVCKQLDGFCFCGNWSQNQPLE